MHCNILCHIVALFRLWSTTFFFYCGGHRRNWPSGTKSQNTANSSSKTSACSAVTRQRSRSRTWKAFRKFCAWSRAINFPRPLYIYILYIDDLYGQCCSSDIYNINCDKCLLTRSIWCRKVVVVASNYSNYQKKPWRINQDANCHVL